MKVGSLFAGIGGFDLAARWMGWETRWFSEIDPYASAVLQKHWPNVPNHGDITKIDFTTVEPVDLLCGGFPCQDISHAGRRKGLSGSRSGLWWEYHRAIRDLRPRYAVVENPTGLLDRGFSEVVGSLSELGYDAEWSVLSAAALGAPHLRERVWIVAFPQHQPDQALRGERPQASVNGTGREDGPRRSSGASGWQEPIRSSGEAWASISDTASIVAGQLRRGERTPEGAAHGDVLRTWLQPEPRRVAHGIPSELDARHRCIGNSVAPGCPYAIFSAIQEAEERMRAA